MKENKYLLDYQTFDEWNKIPNDFLRQELSKDADELNRSFNTFDEDNKISRQEYTDLSNEKRLNLMLYGYYYFLSKGMDSKDSFYELIQHFEKFKNDDKLLKIFGIHLTQFLHKAFLTLLKDDEETKMVDAPILLSSKIPSNIKKIKVIVPVVPIKSPFTIYIASIIADLITNLSQKSDVEYEIDIGWNELSYETIRKNMVRHFNFDRQLTFDNLKPLIENNFLTLMWNLITTSKEEEEKKRKMDDLRKKFKIVPYDIPDKFDSVVYDTEHELEDLSKMVLEEISDYMPRKSPNLIEYYSDIIFDECSRLDDNQHIIFITPLSMGVLLDYFIRCVGKKNQINSDKYTRACQRVQYLCYLPFPGSEDIRRNLPFYLNEYSYLIYKRKNAETTKTSHKKKYVRRLIISSIKNLNLEVDRTKSIDEKDYDNIVEVLTSIFKREDQRQKDYLRYV